MDVQITSNELQKIKNIVALYFFVYNPWDLKFFGEEKYHKAWSLDNFKSETERGSEKERKKEREREGREG